MSRSSRRRKRRRRDRKRELRAIRQLLEASVFDVLSVHVGQTPAEFWLEANLRAQGYRIVRGSLRITGPNQFSCQYDGEIHSVQIEGTVGV